LDGRRRMNGRQILLAKLDADTEATIRDACATQGCTCGEDLIVEERELDDADEVADEFGAAGALRWGVLHDPNCPLLATTRGGA
jgi:hypothetical protein